MTVLAMKREYTTDLSVVQAHFDPIAMLPTHAFHLTIQAARQAKLSNID
jgi:hypothetical protein